MVADIPDNVMEKLTASELFLYRDFIKEAINLRGFKVAYYELDKNKTMSSAEAQNFYKETVKQEFHYFKKYYLKTLFDFGSTTAYKHAKKWGMTTEFGERGNKELLCVFYGKTPKGLWRNDFGDDTLPDNYIEDSNLYLPVIVKIGDYIRYPHNSSNFFKITSFFDYGWGYFILYRAILIHMPAILSEDSLGIIEEVK